ncbi:type II toxin-antitoxin system RelE/ParE family toxin [Chryseobacterium caseinilyticum]|uniref:Type II toxin-antitoxin system RelE/ParE family toxin n=1 Tax=Chryseobacterium caseinilyticum TaxID=2771428 RepID=A0ABR8ZEL1_9FLAO|nr:type II toxin-antitoxin system RelE/ParE family toxin [Chryseobacterium caseinilyticum]MBD8083715.1 type II toxin-antitoxin system RelE/ParE family toxin [Chryseobacterium caseinilyticum]
MNFVFKNRPRVYNDITEAVEYYLEISPKLASQFLFRVEEAKQRILKSPKGFQIKHSEKIRTVLLKQFDYHIYYILEEDHIVILAILHAHSGGHKIAKV